MDRRNFNRRKEDKHKADISFIALSVVSIFTLIPFIVAIVLAYSGNLTNIQQDLYYTCTITWKSGCMAILSIIGKSIIFQINYYRPPDIQ